MSGFKTELFVSPLSDGRRWRIVDHPVIYERPDSSQITVPVGFVTDFASVPEAFWNVYPPFGKGYGLASIVHDFLYTTQPVAKEIADSIFLEAMISTGVSELTREILYHAVKTFGFEAWRQHAEQLKKTKL